PVPIRDPQVIIQIARRVWDFRLEKSITMNLLRLERLAPVCRSLNASPVRQSDGLVRWRARTGGGSVHHDLDIARVGAERADGEIVAHPMRTQDPERIGMRARE